MLTSLDAMLAAKMGWNYLGWSAGFQLAWVPDD